MDDAYTCKSRYSGEVLFRKQPQERHDQIPWNTRSNAAALSEVTAPVAELRR
jgi:hypothetical protein